MDKRIKILVVDDDSMVLETLKLVFFEEKYDVLFAASGREALSIVKDNPDLTVVILDIRMAEMDGLETAEQLEKCNPETPIIFHTGHPGDYSEAEIEERFHPFDFITKSEDSLRLRREVDKAAIFRQLKLSSRDLVSLARREYGMVGKSRQMLDVYQNIELIGPTDNKVMILGPTGTGKELVAKAIHSRSRRAEKGFGLLQCSNKDAGQVEAELFGHLKDIYTSVGNRTGLFEYYDGGTLFLDEIGELDSNTQAKLLRVLDTGEYAKAGEPFHRVADVRVICATNRDLEQMVQTGEFREDLYFRLYETKIVLPALKDRRDDIPDLVDYFVKLYCEDKKMGPRIFTDSAVDRLIEYDWPGNVRFLKNTIESIIEGTPSSFITEAHVIAHLKLDPLPINRNLSLKERVREFEKIQIIQELNRHKSRKAAAVALGMDPSNFVRKMKDLGLYPEDYPA